MRKLHDGHFYLIEGLPENHSSNLISLGRFSTRRQALRYAKAHGYDVVVKERESLLNLNADRKEIEDMKDVLNLKLSGREAYESGLGEGIWLKLPASADELNSVLEQISAVGEYGVDYFISDFSSTMPVIESLSLEHIQRMSIDELNHIAGEIEQTPDDELEKLNAMFENLRDNEEIQKLAEARKNTDSIGHIPDVFDHAQLGEYLLNHGMVDVPDEFRSAVNVELLGQIAAENGRGAFSESGYTYFTDSPWLGNERTPEEYMIEHSAMAMASAVRESEPEILYEASPAVESNVQAVNQEPTAKSESKAKNQAAVQRSTERAVSASETDRGKKTKRAYPSIPTEAVYKTAFDKHKETYKMMEAGVKEVFESDKYKNYLNVLSKFHNYSYGNCVLITEQMPSATYVAGFNFWRDNMKRHVKRDEKGIKILAPSPYKAMREVEKIGKDGKPYTTDMLVTVPGYKVVHVFDVSQTYGQPMPKLTKDLTESVERYNDLYDALEAMSPVPISFESIKSNAKGYFDPIEKLIVIKDGMSEAQNIKTTIHEIVHARLHDINNAIDDESKRPNSRTREIEAESIAFCVSKNYGLDTSEYSFGYIATWSSDKELPELKASLGVIRKEVNSIINEVDTKLLDIQKEKDIALAARVDKAIETERQLKIEAQEHEEIVQEILTEIKRIDPEHPAKDLAYIEDNMRNKSTPDLLEIDYAFYFPDKYAAIAKIEMPDKTDEKQAAPETESKPVADTKPKDTKSENTVTKTPAKSASKAASKATAKSGTTKRTANSKQSAPKKTGIRAELEAAKKQAAAYKKDSPAQTKSKGMEL